MPLTLQHGLPVKSMMKSQASSCKADENLLEKTPSIVKDNTLAFGPLLEFLLRVSAQHMYRTMQYTNEHNVDSFLP